MSETRLMQDVKYSWPNVQRCPVLLNMRAAFSRCRGLITASSFDTTLRNKQLPQCHDKNRSSHMTPYHVQIPIPEGEAFEVL